VKKGKLINLAFLQPFTLTNQNQTNMKKIILIFLVFFAFKTYSQEKSILLGTDFPIQYTAGGLLEYQNFSTQLQFGALTKPYDDVILSVIEGFGADSGIINIVRKAYERGFVFTVKQNYHFKNGIYTGLYLQYLTLHAAETPLDIIESYYPEFELVTIWNKPFPFNFADRYGDEVTELQLKSNLLQMGLLVGYRYSIPNSNFELRTELTFSKNIFSSNQFSSQTPYPELLYEKLDEDISETYTKYAYIPSINLYFVIKID
jgi:hypothetical protein